MTRPDHRVAEHRPGLQHCGLGLLHLGLHPLGVVAGGIDLLTGSLHLGLRHVLLGPDLLQLLPGGGLLAIKVFVVLIIPGSLLFSGLGRFLVRNGGLES